jgi:hypothetical protein
LANQYAELQREQDLLNEKIARLEAAQAEQEADLSGLKSRRAVYEKEIGTPIVSNLSSAEMRELESLAKEVDERKKVLVELAKSKSDVSGPVPHASFPRPEPVRMALSWAVKRVGLRSSSMRVCGAAGRNYEIRSILLAKSIRATTTRRMISMRALESLPR